MTTKEGTHDHSSLNSKQAGSELFVDGLASSAFLGR